MQDAKHIQTHKKKKFTPEEDSKLTDLVLQYGDTDWSKIASFMDGRNKRQCRERWRHYLSPNVSTEPFTEEEDKLLHYKYLEYGHKWKLIAQFFPNRTDITIKNHCLFLHRKFQRSMKMKNQSDSKILQFSNFNANQFNSNFKYGLNCNLNFYPYYEPIPTNPFHQVNQFYSKSSMQSPTSPAPDMPSNTFNHESFDSWAENISNCQWDDVDISKIESKNRSTLTLFS